MLTNLGEFCVLTSKLEPDIIYRSYNAFLEKPGIKT